MRKPTERVCTCVDGWDGENCTIMVCGAAKDCNYHGILEF